MFIASGSWETNLTWERRNQPVIASHFNCCSFPTSMWSSHPLPLLWDIFDPERLGACRLASDSPSQRFPPRSFLVKTIPSLGQTSSAETRTGFLGTSPENVRAKSPVFLETAIQNRNPRISWGQARGELKATLPALPYLPDLCCRFRS